MSDEIPRPQSVASVKPLIMNAPGEHNAPTEEQTDKPVEKPTEQPEVPTPQVKETPEEFNSQEFVDKIFGEITKEEQEAKALMENTNDAKFKAIMQKTMEHNEAQAKQMTELLQSQQKVIESLQAKVDTLTPGSKVNDVPTQNPFSESKPQSKGLDVHSEEFKNSFARKFNIPGLK